MNNWSGPYQNREGVMVSVCEHVLVQRTLFEALLKLLLGVTARIGREEVEKVAAAVFLCDSESLAGNVVRVADVAIQIGFQHHLGKEIHQIMEPVLAFKQAAGSFLNEVFKGSASIDEKDDVQGEQEYKEMDAEQIQQGKNQPDMLGHLDIADMQFPMMNNFLQLPGWD